MAIISRCILLHFNSLPVSQPSDVCDKSFKNELILSTEIRVAPTFEQLILGLLRYCTINTNFKWSVYGKLLSYGMVDF